GLRRTRLPPRPEGDPRRDPAAPPLAVARLPCPVHPGRPRPGPRLGGPLRRRRGGPPASRPAPDLITLAPGAIVALSTAGWHWWLVPILSGILFQGFLTGSEA